MGENYGSYKAVLMDNLASRDRLLKYYKKAYDVCVDYISTGTIIDQRGQKPERLAAKRNATKMDIGGK